MKLDYLMKKFRFFDFNIHFCHFSVILQKDLKLWFAELNVDMEKVQEISRSIVALFELWKTYDEKKEIQELLGKMPKPQPQARQ